MIKWIRDVFNSPKTPLILRVWMFTTIFGFIAVLLIFIVALTYNWRGFVAYYSLEQTKKKINFDAVRYENECTELMRETYGDYRIAKASELRLQVTVKYHTKAHPFTIYCINEGTPELFGVQEYFEKRSARSKQPMK